MARLWRLKIYCEYDFKNLDIILRANSCLSYEMNIPNPEITQLLKYKLTDLKINMALEAAELNEIICHGGSV